MIPTTNSKDAYASMFYLCTGEDTGYSGKKYKSCKLTKDGEYHTATVNLNDVEGWSGVIKKIRFDYFEGCSAGDVIYIKSINLK